MKKQITALFILIFIAAGLAAETGYKGIQWGSSEFMIEYYEGKEENPMPEIQKGFKIKVYEKQLLGENTHLFYDLYQDVGLVRVFYSTSNTNTEKLKTNLKSKNLVGTIAYPTTDKTFVEQMRTYGEKIGDPDRFYEYSIGFILSSIPAGLETEYRYNWPKLEGDGLISIYDYNDDTRIYIFENIIPEKTVVVYFPHEEDY